MNQDNQSTNNLSESFYSLTDFIINEVDSESHTQSSDNSQLIIQNDDLNEILSPPSYIPHRSIAGIRHSPIQYNRFNTISRFMGNSYFRRQITQICNEKATKKKYSKLFLKSFQKLENQTLIFIPRNENLYNPFFMTYNKNIQKASIKKFIHCLPNISILEQCIMKQSFNKRKNIKNILYIKICLDLFDVYYNHIDSIRHIERFFNKFLPVYILFYTTITKMNLLFIIKEIKTIKTNFYENNPRFIEFERDQFLQHYIIDKSEKNNLIGGIEMRSELFMQ